MTCTHRTPDAEQTEHRAGGSLETGDLSVSKIHHLWLPLPQHKLNTEMGVGGRGWGRNDIQKIATSSRVLVLELAFLKCVLSVC